MKFAESTATVTGNAVFDDTVKMSVNNESLPHIIKSLTDMYSNPVLAISREYLSNAYDATVARMGSGSSFGTVLDTPIEVTLPSGLNPNFIVRDYGTGMDKDTLANVFPQYGASTKRDNNTEIGGFGLGAKSALAVVANFTVVSVKDGKKNTGIVQKGADGVGEVSFLPEQETDEPSGTTITIVLPKPSELNRCFNDSNLLLGFPHGSIMLNGKMHDNSVFNTDLYTKVGEDGWVINSLLDWENSSNGNRSVGSSWEKVVVVGPISYRVSRQDLLGDDYSRSDLADGAWDASNAYTVLNLPIGSVDFTPARENLIFSERTRKTILEAAKRLSKGVHTLAQESISKAENKRAAVNRSETLRMNGFELDFTYNGEKIPRRTDASLEVEGKKAWESSRNCKATPRGIKLGYGHSDSSHTVVVTDVKDAETAKTLNRLRKPFADRHHKKLHTDNLTVLYMENGKDALNEWAEHLVFEILTADEWEAKGTAYRKEINAEKRAAKAASNTTSTINHGSVPVGILKPNHYKFDRPKVESSYAAEVAKADHVIYVRLDKQNTETFSHKFAQNVTNGYDGFDIAGMNYTLSAVRSHYGQDNKHALIVRIPANTKVDTFLKAVPHAISMDEAVKTVAASIVKTQDPLALLIAKRQTAWNWLDALDESNLKEIQNDEVREFITAARKVHGDLNGYSTKANHMASSRMVFTDAFAEMFGDYRKQVEGANKFPLPLLADVGRNFKAANGIQYINLMFPAEAAATLTVAA